MSSGSKIPCCTLASASRNSLKARFQAACWRREAAGGAAFGLPSQEASQWRGGASEGFFLLGTQRTCRSRSAAMRRAPNHLRT
eukprot:2495943-Heterocapsa_arctica.AAC.1